MDDLTGHHYLTNDQYDHSSYHAHRLGQQQETNQRWEQQRQQEAEQRWDQQEQQKDEQRWQLEQQKEDEQRRDKKTRR